MNRTGNSMAIVCYDISSNRLRTKIDKCMKDYGTRIQYSVFMCRLGGEDMMRCKAALEGVLERYKSEREPDDSVIVLERISLDRVVSLAGDRAEMGVADFTVL